jgi:hypothetical protein
MKRAKLKSARREAFDRCRMEQDGAVKERSVMRRCDEIK